MKNKLFAILLTAVYIIGMLALPAFAEENAPALPPNYAVTGIVGNSIQAGGSGYVQVRVSSTNGVNAYKLSGYATTNGGITVSSYPVESFEFSPTFGFLVTASETAEGSYSLTLNLNMYDEAGNLLGMTSLDVPVTVVNNSDPEGLVFANFATDKDVVKAGDEFSLTFILKNETGLTLDDVKVTLPGLDSGKFVMDGGFTYKSIGIANGASGVVAFDLIAMEGISSVRETISALAEYTVAGAKQTASCNVIITCDPEKPSEGLDNMSLTMIDYKSSSDRIRPGRTFTLTITVENSSDEDIEKARIDIQNLDGRVFAVNEGLTYRDFSIKAGEKKSLKFTLIGCDGISSTREVLPVSISYGGISDIVYCTLSCKPEEQTTPETEQVFAPNIIITDYDFGGEFVVAGSKFPLSVTFQNMSDVATIENLKIVIDGGSSANGGIAFSASNSANSFFFEKLDPKATDTVVMEMLAKSDATPNSYPIEISFSYEYTVGGKRYQASTINETLNVPLQQEDRLKVNDPSYPNWVVYVGDSCYVSTSLVNMGKSGVYNVTASIEGEGFTMNEASYYIGNIESGREEYYDTEIFPNMAGEINCELVVTYEDSNGNAKEKRIPFTVQVQEMMVWDEPVIDEPIMDGDVGFVEDGYYDEFGNWIPTGGSAEQGLPMWAWIAIGVGGAVVVIVVIVIIVKAKKKKSFDLEDDDEDI